MFIGHYAALPPVRCDPHCPHIHAIPASIRLFAFTHALQHPLIATQTSAVVTTTCLDYLHSHTSTPERCAHPRPRRYISTPALNGYWVWYTPAPRSRRDTATHTARDSNPERGRRRGSYRYRVVCQSSSSVWVTAWPTTTCGMSNTNSNNQLAGCACAYICACCMLHYGTHGGAGGAPPANVQ
jgi:hypothetical protein